MDFSVAIVPYPDCLAFGEQGFLSPGPASVGPAGSAAACCSQIDNLLRLLSGLDSLGDGTQIQGVCHVAMILTLSSLCSKLSAELAVTFVRRLQKPLCRVG